MNLKKIIATNLSFIFTVSFCKDSVFANWTPYDYKDPTCINISMLGNGIDRMHLPKEKKFGLFQLKKRFVAVKLVKLMQLCFHNLMSMLKNFLKK